MGRFVKGQSGNPGGKCKTTIKVEIDGEVRDATLAELARPHTFAALQTLVDITQDERAPKPARVSAATALLDRGWGKPRQELELSGPDGGPIETSHAGPDLSRLSTEELRNLEAIREKLAADPASRAAADR